MSMRVLFGILGLVLCASALAGPAAAINIPACAPLSDFVVVSKNEIDLESGPTVISGNMIVTSQTGVIEVGRFNVIHGTLIANTLRLGNDAHVDVCQANNFQGVDPATVCGSIIQPLTFPTCVPDSTFNPVAVDSCVNSAGNRTIPANATESLASGSCVGVLRINDGATLNATGISNIKSLVMGNGSKLVGPATINIKGGFTSEANVTTDSIVFNVAGTANSAITPGNSSQFINTLFNVPAGGIHIRADSSFQGDTEIVSRRTTIQPITAGDVCRLEVTKECSVTGAAPPFMVNFVGSVTNTGTTVVNPLSVVNNQPNPNTPVQCKVANVAVTQLQPGQTCDISGSYTPSGQPPFTDTLTANGSTSGGATCTASAPASCEPNAQPGNCPEDPLASAGGPRECDRCVILTDPNNFCAGKPKHATWQAAIAAAAAGDVICVYTNTKENVNIAGPADLTITQCTNAKVTAADFSKPVVTIKSTASNTLIIGPDAIGGTIGWCLEPGAFGHELRGVRASDATRCGILDRGGQNLISFNSIDGVVPGAGVCIAATQSTIRGGTVKDNAIGVVFDGSTSSVFQNARVQSNGPTSPVGATTGIVVRLNSNGNIVRNNRCTGNDPSDPDIANFGVGTSLLSNQCELPPPAGVNPTFVMPADCN